MGYAASSVSAGSPSPPKFGNFLLCFSSHYFFCHHFLLGIFSLLSSPLLFLFLFPFLHCFSFSLSYRSLFPLHFLSLRFSSSTLPSVLASASLTISSISNFLKKLVSFSLLLLFLFASFTWTAFPHLLPCSLCRESSWRFSFVSCLHFASESVTANTAGTMNSNFPGKPIIISGSDPSMLVSHA